MDTEYLNDPEHFQQEITDPVASDLLSALGSVVMEKDSNPAGGFALYRVQHDGWRVSDMKDFSPYRRWGNKKFGKGKRVTQINRALDALKNAGIISSWEARSPLNEEWHIFLTLSDRWGDIHAEQAKREKARSDREAIGRMRSIAASREKARRARAEVHRKKQALLLEYIPALVEYVKGIDPDTSTPERGWNTVDHKVRSAISEMETAMYERQSNEEWMQREMQEA